MKKRYVKRFINYYKPYKGLFFLDLLAAVIMSGIAILYPILSRMIFNDFVKRPDKQGVIPIVICSIVLLLVYIIRALLEYFVTYFGHMIGVRMQRDMRKELFLKYQDLPFSYYDEHNIGELMSRMTTDLWDISEFAHHCPETFLTCTVTILGSFIYLLTVNYILALILLLCLPILIGVTFLTRNNLNRTYADNKAKMGMINARIESSLSGIRVTKAYNNKNKEVEIFDDINKEYVNSRMNTYKYMGIFHATSEFAMDIINVICISIGAILVIYTNIFNIGDYLAFAISISLFIQPIKRLVQFLEVYQEGKSGFVRFINIMDTPIDRQKDNVIKKIDLKGNIEFRHVDFKYETSNEVLNDVSFKINKGETIALVGTSGGGKSTICHLIPNFYHVKDGHIFFDNTDINDISFEALRENIGIVEQDIFLFNDTIKNNIKYAKLDATDEEIINAAKKANIYDFIMSLPNKFDSYVGERGVKLSGGQKQRVSIARVFLKNPSILILDEATSALDNTTEIEIQKSLNELAKDRTSIVVAHRLSTIKHADRIFVIEEGKILEEGTHNELMNSKGRYAKLYNQQFSLN